MPHAMIPYYSTPTLRHLRAPATCAYCGGTGSTPSGSCLSCGGPTGAANRRALEVDLDIQRRSVEFSGWTADFLMAQARKEAKAQRERTLPWWDFVGRMLGA